MLPHGLRYGAVGRYCAMIALAFALGTGMPSAAAGQGVGVSATVDRNPVAVNQPFTLSITVSGVRGLDGEPEFPDIDEFARYLGSNQSTNMRVVNGQANVSVVVAYRWIPTREGTFEIPGVVVRAAGQTLLTDPISITVVSASTAAADPQNTGPVITEEDLFLVAEASKSRVYENEPILVTYRVFTRVNVNSYQVASSPSTEGFWSEEIPTPANGPQVEQVTRDGVAYASAAVRQVVLFPTGPGTREIEPMSLEARVRVERGRRDLFSDFFGGGSLFGSLVPVMVESDPISVEVLPLPPGAPAGFAGFVGRLDVTSSLDRADVDANEAVTLTVRVTGEGNLSGLVPPSIEFPPDFEVFEPEMSENISRSGGVVSGSKTWEYVLIPRAPGDREIPGVSMAYFDAPAGRYRTTEAPPIPLTVTGEAPAPGTTSLRGGVETLREDIRFIRLGTPRLTRSNTRLFDSLGFWIVALLPMVAVLGAVGLRKHEDRMSGDVAYARGRRAGRVAKKRLAHARELAGGSDSKAFYAEAARALQGFLADKLNLAEAGLMTDQVRRELDGRGVSSETADEYLACIEHCDMQRFAPSGDAAADERFLERTEKAMTALDQELGR